MQDEGRERGGWVGVGCGAGRLGLEDEFRLSLLLQTIEDRDRGTLTIEQG